MGRNSKLKQERRELKAKGLVPPAKIRNLIQRQQKVAMLEEQLRESATQFSIPPEHNYRLKEFIANGTDYVAEYPQEHMGKILIVELYADKDKPCHYIIRTPENSSTKSEPNFGKPCTVSLTRDGNLYSEVINTSNEIVKPKLDEGTVEEVSDSDE